MPCACARSPSATRSSGADLTSGLTFPAYRLVILDFDGTLADSGEWFARVLNPVARRYRFRQISREELEAMRGEPPAAMLRRLRVARWKLPLIARHMRGLMARDIAEISLFSGVAALLEALSRAGVPLAIVSSNAEANVRGVLGPELSAHIDHFACGSSLFGKAPKIRRLVKRCGVPPLSVLAIGDEIRDIDAAEAAGVASGAVAWGYAHPDALRARRPTWMFERAGDVADAVLAPDLAAADR